MISQIRQVRREQHITQETLAVRAGTKKSNISRLESQLNALKLDNDEEYSRITSSVDLEEVKRIAIQELGMQQPRSEQIYYISSGVADKAEIITPEHQKNGLQKVFSAIGEYLR